MDGSLTVMDQEPQEDAWRRHVREAEKLLIKLLGISYRYSDSARKAEQVLAEAQVHATLAVALRPEGDHE